MAVSPNTTQTISYNGSIQTIELDPGRYRITCCGAKGGGDQGAGGNLTSGILNIKEKTKFNIQCGQMPTTINGGYPNGIAGDYAGKYGGGGSTKIYKTNGEVILEAKGGQGQGLVGGTTSATATRTKADGFTKFVDRSGVRCMEITPTVSGTLYFRSTSFSADPWGFIDIKNADGSFTNVDSNDDAGGNLNFLLSITVQAGKTYCLRVGAYSRAGNSYWYATYPDSNVKIYVAVATGGEGGGNDVINRLLTNTSSQKFYNKNNGYVSIANIGYSVQYKDCSGTVTTVFGNELLKITFPQTVKKPDGFYYYFSELVWSPNNQARNFIEKLENGAVYFRVPKNIYDFNVSLIIFTVFHESKMRTNSNFYKNARTQDIFDFLKLLEE